MKTKIYNFLKIKMLAFVLIFFSTQVLSQTLIAYWNFNTGANGTAWNAPIPASHGNGSITAGTWTWGNQNFTEGFAGSTQNALFGDPSGASLSLRSNEMNGNHIQFEFSMAGYENLVISYWTQRTATGFNSNQWSWSSDGVNFFNFGPVINPPLSPGEVITLEISDLNGVETAYLRYTLDGATATAGNNRIDNLQLNASQPGAVLPPTNLAASAVSKTQINLSWNLNADNDPVLVAWSEDGTFGNPVGTYNAGDNITGGGIVLYAGSDTFFAHEGLQAGTTYYYRAWSNDGGDYSSGISTSGTTMPDPAFTTLPYSETFNSDLGDCYTYSVSGPTRFWVYATTDGNGYAMMNGFNSGELEEDWLILPGIDMNDYSNVILNFETAWNFGEENDNNYLKLYYSTNYAGIGDPEDASWTDLEFVKPTEGGYIWQSSGNIDLSGIQGVVWIGFKYHFSENYRRWQVDNIHVFEADAPLLTVEPANLSGFAYQIGSGPSAEQSFAVSGINLNDDITVIPSENFEISTVSGAVFTATNPIVLPHDNGTVEPTTIYVRLKAGLEIGDYNNEQIVISSPEASSATVTCSGTVSPEVSQPLVIDTPDFLYTQDFNSLASSGTGNPWTDNETILGWYWQSPGDRDPNVAGYNANDGTSTAANAISFGATGNTDRAMGAISGASNRDYYHGVQFLNNTGNALNLSEIYLSYTGEQWRQTANEQTLAFSFTVSSTVNTSLLGGNWISNPVLDFVSPHSGTAAAMNGNDPDNRVVFSNVPLASDGILANGSYLTVRWAKTGTTSPGLAIDDFVFSLTEVVLIDNPVNFTATAYNTTEIEVSWGLNANSDPVLVARSADGVFGTVPDTQTVGEEISGGGIVMYFGSNTSLTHEELEPGTTYYYKAWSYDAGSYSPGVVAQATTFALPATTTLPYNETFDNDLGQCYVYNVSGPTKYWIHDSFGENGFARMNGFNSGDLEEDWLILPGINFTNYENEIMTFDTWWRFAQDDENNYLKLFYSTNYSGTGNPTGATWTELNFNSPQMDQTWDTSGTIDLSGLSGEMVYIGFKYRYEPENYRLWQVDNISISGDPVGINEKYVQNQLNISPNPTSGFVRVELPHHESEIRVYDLPGSIITIVQTSQKSYVLDLGSFKKGVYLIEVVSPHMRVPARAKVILQ